MTRKLGILCAGLLAVGCGDDGGGGGLDASTVCETAADCDDGVFCNGAEVCTAGVCAPGEAACAATERCDEVGSMCIADCTNPDMDGDGADAVECGGDDCDDTNPNANPSAIEVCDAEGVDEDCDPTTLGPDRDGDGFAPIICCNGDTCGTDCDDGARSVAPGAAEACNVVDDDCDGSVDEGVAGPGYADMDGDRHGDPDSEVDGCPVSPGFSFVGDDCDDSDPTTPGEEILGDGADNDCDGSVDEGDGSAVRPFWPDTDGDGYGDGSATPVDSAVAIEGYSPVPGDCAPTNPNIHPGADELCNGIDDDCNGSLDGEDDDGDGVPDAACSPDGPADCDDRNPEVFPGAPEICDGVDNDCDDATGVDEDCVSVTWYADGDGDGVGAGAGMESATPIDGYSTLRGDCDDGDPTIRPGALERCDGVDQDCDGVTDEAADSSCGGRHMTGFCAAGSCRITCENGWGECDDEIANGCEADLSRPATCGSCDNICTTAPNGAPGCVDFECTFTCLGAWADCNDDVAADGCETNTLADEANCGGCGMGCRVAADTVATCSAGSCSYDCATNYGDCDGDLDEPSPTNWCETRTDRAPDDCGSCGMACTTGSGTCLSGACSTWSFSSTGADGTFTYADTATDVMAIMGGVYHFDGDVVIPSGKTLRVTGDGVLDLRASGEIRVEGTIDASGGDGANGTLDRCGGGGGTGNGVDGATEPAARASGGVVGQGGDGDLAGLSWTCGQGGRYGGGHGGVHPSETAYRPGGGGGGIAGGAGGTIDGSGLASGAGGGSDGGVTTGQGGQAPGVYAGNDGSRATNGHWGGGGGSIGSVAAGDLRVMSTFAPGSGGGGGASNMGSAGGFDDFGGGGGGGGGGAIRLASDRAVIVAASGAVLANGGAGGTSRAEPGEEGGCGGGGSGGVVYVAAPSVEIRGPVEAQGGNGGMSTQCAFGGAGGLGRIRISAHPEQCVIDGGTTNPATTCTPSPMDGMAGEGYMAVFPN